MDNYLLIYLWTRLPFVFYLFGFSCAILAFIAVSFIYHYKTGNGIWFDTSGISLNKCHKLADEHNIKLAKRYENNKYIRLLVGIVFFTGLLNIIVPSQKDALTIYILPKIAAHSSLEEWDKVFNSMPKAIQGLLEEYIPKEKE